MLVELTMVYLQPNRTEVWKNTTSHATYGGEAALHVAMRFLANPRLSAEEAAESERDQYEMRLVKSGTSRADTWVTAVCTREK